MRELTLGSLFDGLGGWLLAAKENGIRSIWSSEIDDFPMAVSKYHFPEVQQLGDITKLDGAELPPVDIICAGSPCQDLSIAGKREGLAGERSGLFRKAIDIVRGMRKATNGEHPKWFVWENVCFAKSTLISTQSGFKEIQDVVVGDKVLTKSGQYHEVEQTFITKKQMTLKLQVCGAETITVTPRHPFWVKQKEESKAGLASWKCAEELRRGDWIAYRTDGFGEKTIGKPFAYAVGRWLADGSIVQRDSHHNGSRGGQRYRIFISTGYKKFSLLKEELSKLPYRISENKMKHAVNFTFSSDYFAKLIESCGKGALNKRLPEYVFQLPFEEQKELLRGYLDGDGYLRRKNEVSCCTTSRHLAYGLARLVRNVYHVGCGISYSLPRKCVVIENRIVKSRGAYNCYFSIPSHRKAKNVSSYFDDGFVWCRVKNIENGGLEDVYNLSVSRDNTYCANGVTVHNCGAFSSNKGHDFRAVLEEITETDIPMPDSGRWSKGGLVRSPKCNVAWRTLDAQYWGVPQRRARIFLIAGFGADSRPEVLFEPESLFRNTEESQDKRKSATRDTAQSADTTSWAFEPGITSRDGRKLTENKSTTLRADMGDNQTAVLAPWDVQSNRIVSENGKAATLYGGAGQGTHNGAVMQSIGLDLYNGNTTGDIAATITASSGKSASQSGPSVMQKCYGISSYESNSMKSQNPSSGIYEADKARTLDTSGGNPACNQGGIAVIEAKTIGIATQSYYDMQISDKGATLRAAGGAYGGGSENYAMQISER